MKTLRFIFLLIITLAFAITLNTKMGSVPPLGKFLSPFHGFWKNAEKEGINYEETLNLEGLSQPVKVYYDEMRIPHIYASNNIDLRIIQGYITARDRLWQMDFFSRLVMGRLSEVIGRRALSFDRLNRRIGLKRMTEDQWKLIQKNPELEETYKAYSKGVNQYIDALSYDQYPLEFKLLDYEPEAWTPLKSCLAYPLLANTLSKSESDLENTNMLSLFGREIFDLLYPDQLGNIDPVIRSDKTWDFEAITAIKPDINFPDIITQRTIEKPHPLNGSNNFVVAGSKTKNGFPLFANEPDLELKIPSIWHASHLNSGKKNVMGVTVPGAPLIIIGFNDDIAWGVTNSPRDQVDWYSIQFRNEERKEYLYNNQWFKTEEIVEEIKIAGEQSFFDKVAYTHHGPVVYDEEFLPDNGKKNFAMRWIAHDPNSTISAINDLNTAKGYEDFELAMTKFQGPPQNFLFASNSGDIAIALPGKFPIKWEEQGKFLMDGSDPRHEWSDYIPFEHFMRDKNPESGFLSSANQHPVSDAYPYYVYDHNYEYYRGRRINDRLKELNEITPKDMMQLQNDNYNFMASESLPMMLNAVDTTLMNKPERAFYNELSKWDYFSEPNNKASTLYELWWDHTYSNLWDEFDTISIAYKKPNKYVSIDHLKNDSSALFTNILGTSEKEDANQLMSISFSQAVESLNAWKTTNGDDIQWYKFKNTSVKHMLGLEPFSRLELKIGGYSGIVNAASGNHGPSWRMVVELDPNGTKAWGVYPGSQTGNPGSPLYGHLIDKWAAGEYYELLFARDISQSDQVIFTQTAQPK